MALQTKWTQLTTWGRPSRWLKNTLSFVFVCKYSTPTFDGWSSSYVSYRFLYGDGSKPTIPYLGRWISIDSSWFITIVMNRRLPRGIDPQPVAGRNISRSGWSRPSWLQPNRLLLRHPRSELSERSDGVYRIHSPLKIMGSQLEQLTPIFTIWLVFTIHLFFPECVARVPVSLWGSGGWGCVRSTLRLWSQPFATVRNRPQPSAIVRNRSQPFVWGPYGRAYGKFCRSFLEVSNVSLLRFAWQAWHFVTFRRVLERVESRFAWQAQYFCDVFRICVAFFVAGAALWTCPSSFFVAGAAL